MSSVIALVEEYKALSIISRRAVAAIVGACVGDAATRPVHWVYDRNVIENTIKNENPEFWPVSLSPFYSLETGRRSCYNDECLVMFNSLEANESNFNKDHVEECLLQMFHPTSEYAEALTRRVKAYESSQRTTHKDPVPGPWQQSAVTQFLKAKSEHRAITGDTQSNETDGFCLSIPLVASLCVHPDCNFDTTVQTAVQILSASDAAVQHSLVRARILKAIISTESFTTATVPERQALISNIIVEHNDQTILQELNTVLNSLPSHTELTTSVHIDMVQDWGKACGDPGNLQACLLALSSSDSYRQAVRRNIVAGGCNCSRVNFIGACFGAMYGIDADTSSGSKGIPLEWIERVDIGKDLFARAIKLFQ